MRDRVLAAYAKLAADYEQSVDTASAFNAYYERPAMLKHLPEDLRGRSVLDAGCAAGWYTEQLLKRGATVTAIDASPAMVEAAGRRVGRRAQIMLQDLTDPLPFAAGSFDWVVSSLVLHYIEDWAQTFREFRRVLKPDGHVLFSIGHPFMDMTYFQRADYFCREWVTDVWNKAQSGTLEMHFVSRPLSEVINATTACFRLVGVEEPQPIPEFLKKFPDRADQYAYLMTRPHFLIVYAENSEG